MTLMLLHRLEFASHMYFASSNSIMLIGMGGIYIQIKMGKSPQIIYIDIYIPKSLSFSLLKSISNTCFPSSQPPLSFAAVLF